MHLVALRSPEGEATALARVLGSSAYEARQRLAGSGPRVVATLGDAEAATRLATALTEAGFAATVVPVGGAARIVPRTFVVEPAALRVVRRDGTSLPLAWTQMRLLLRGTRIASEVQTETVEERRFSLGRAALTGGLVVTKATTHARTRTVEEREGFLHVHSAGTPGVTLVEGELLYDGLGPEREATRMASFARLVALVRARATRARFDDRLLTRAGQAGVLRGVLPDGFLDAAVAVLVHLLPAPEPPAPG